MYLFMAVSVPAVYGTLVDRRMAEIILFKGFGERSLPFGRFFGLIDTYHSPLFVFLLFLLCLNLAVCTLTRFSRRGSGERTGHRGAQRWLDLLMHTSIVVILAGGGIKGMWAFTGTKNIHVGTTADTVLDWRIGEEVSPGFAIAVQDRVDEYYPAEIRIGVTDAATGDRLGLVELGERYGGELPTQGIALTLERFDRFGLAATVRASFDGEEHEIELQGEEGGRTASLGPYNFTLVAWRQDLKTVRSLLGIIEDGKLVKEAWIAPNARVTHKGTSLYQTAWGEDQYRNPFTGIQVVRDPGAPVFWVGCVLFSFLLPPYLVVRHGRRSPARELDTSVTA